MALPHGISCVLSGRGTSSLEAVHIELLPPLKLHAREAIPHSQRTTVLDTLYHETIVAQVAYLTQAIGLPSDEQADTHSK